MHKIDLSTFYPETLDFISVIESADSIQIKLSVKCFLQGSIPQNCKATSPMLQNDFPNTFQKVLGNCQSKNLSDIVVHRML